MNHTWKHWTIAWSLSCRFSCKFMSRSALRAVFGLTLCPPFANILNTYDCHRWHARWQTFRNNYFPIPQTCRQSQIGENSLSLHFHSHIWINMNELELSWWLSRNSIIKQNEEKNHYLYLLVFSQLAFGRRSFNYISFHSTFYSYYSHPQKNILPTTKQHEHKIEN